MEATAGNISIRLARREGTLVCFEKVPRRRSVVLGLASLAVLVACSNGTTTRTQSAPSPPAATGEIAKSAKAILADARRELLATRSVRVTGTISTKAGTPTTEKIDLRLGHSAKGEALAMGTVTTTLTSAGRTSQVAVELVRVGGDLYLHGDRDYYARIDPRVASVGGQWLSLPVGQDRSLSDLTDVTQLASGLNASGASTAGRIRFGTQQAIVVRAGGALAYVAASGRPLLLRLQRPQGNAVAGLLNFTGYDAALSVRPPARSVPLQSLLAGPSS